MITDVIYNKTAPIKQGDWILEESEQTHIEDILITNKGEYRQHPLVGVGALNFLNSTLDKDTIRKRVSVQLEYDNFKVDDISLLRDGSIRISARQNEQI